MQAFSGTPICTCAALARLVRTFEHHRCIFRGACPRKILDFHCILSGALVASLSIKRIKKNGYGRSFFILHTNVGSQYHFVLRTASPPFAQSASVFCFRRNCYCGGIIQRRIVFAQSASVFCFRRNCYCGGVIQPFDNMQKYCYNKKDNGGRCLYVGHKNDCGHRR